MILYLVRHGETNWNRAGRLQGQTDIELNEKGREQAAKLRGKLAGVELDAAFSSSLTRARQTRQIILDGRNVPAWDEPLLKEMNFGQWEGDMLKEIRADKDHPLHDLFVRPGRYEAPQTAESFEDLYRRTWKFMNEKLRPLETAYGHVLIVATAGRGGVSSILLRAFRSGASGRSRWGTAPWRGSLWRTENSACWNMIPGQRIHRKR